MEDLEAHCSEMLTQRRTE